jgi:hypothetical protein
MGKKPSNEKSDLIHNLLHHYYMTFGSGPTPTLCIPNPVGAVKSRRSTPEMANELHEQLLRK